jgi:hypothetical protein
MNTDGDALGKSFSSKEHLVSLGIQHTYNLCITNNSSIKKKQWILYWTSKGASPTKPSHMQRKINYLALNLQ